MLNVACYLLKVEFVLMWTVVCCSCWMLNVERKMLPVACWMLNVAFAWFMLPVTWFMLPVAWCMLHDACCMMHVAWCMLHDAWCMTHVAWYKMHDACCTLNVIQLQNRICCALHDCIYTWKQTVCIHFHIPWFLYSLQAKKFTILLRESLCQIYFSAFILLILELSAPLKSLQKTTANFSLLPT